MTPQTREAVKDEPERYAVACLDNLRAAIGEVVGMLPPNDPARQQIRALTLRWMYELHEVTKQIGEQRGR